MKLRINLVTERHNLRLLKFLVIWEKNEETFSENMLDKIYIVYKYTKVIVRNEKLGKYIPYMSE